MTERNETAQPAPLGQVERGVGPLEPKRGIQHPDLTHMRETRRGTQYEVCEWTCPKCRKPRSTLYIDGEWCHGESYHIAFGQGPNGEPAEQCGTCWREEIDAMPHNRSKRPNVELT
jgi:hypothetical protein